MIAELQDGIQVLRSKVADRIAKSRGLRDHWKGGYADSYFETQQPQLKIQAHDSISQMQAIIKQIQSAAEQAAADQRGYQASQAAPSPAAGGSPA